MALHLATHVFSALPELRIHPSPKRIRALVGGDPVVDSTRALVVWEPRRIVPTYAVPIADIRADLTPVTAESADEHAVTLDGEGPPVLDPSTGFTAHTTDGQSYSIGDLTAAAFTPSDPELDGYAVLDFAAFDEWLEEDEVLVAHARDPFTRIDTRRSSRHVVVEIGGVTIADSTRSTLLFETHLPTRYYFPREDVRMDLFAPSEKRSACAYKGYARYWSAEQVPDVAWTYEDPHQDAVPVKDMVCFFNERVDLVIDGERLERPVTPWS